MDYQPDYRELFALFNARKVEYLVVGAYALAFHGAPRYTGDIDILLRPHAANATAVLSALHDFGFGSLGLTVDDFSSPDMVVQLGVPPVRIDLLTSLTGVVWEEACADSEAGLYADVPVRYLGKAALIRNKRALGRKKDLADLEAIGED